MGDGPKHINSNEDQKPRRALIKLNATWKQKTQQIDSIHKQSITDHSRNENHIKRARRLSTGGRGYFEMRGEKIRKSSDHACKSRRMESRKQIRLLFIHERRQKQRRSGRARQMTPRFAARPRLFDSKGARKSPQREVMEIVFQGAAWVARKTSSR